MDNNIKLPTNRNFGFVFSGITDCWYCNNGFRSYQIESRRCSPFKFSVSFAISKDQAVVDTTASVVPDPFLNFTEPSSPRKNAIILRKKSIYN